MTWEKSYRKQMSELPPDKQSYYLPSNPYNYVINLRNPYMKLLYYQWKDMNGIPRWIPLSDVERHRCDGYIVAYLKGADNPQYQK